MMYGIHASVQLIMLLDDNSLGWLPYFRRLFKVVEGRLSLLLFPRLGIDFD